MTIRWQPATSPSGAITYRVYRDDALLGTATGDSFNDSVDAASAHTWAVRAQDALGFFGPLQAIRTTPTAAATTTATTPTRTAPARSRPSAAQALRVTATRTGILLRWRPGAGGTKAVGYRVARSGKLYAQPVEGTSLAVPEVKAKGSWVVYAVDAAGRVSGPSTAVRIT